MTVASVERAFELLKAIDQTDGTLSALARRTGLPVATVSRLMATLEETGAVRRRDRIYRIGPTVVALAEGTPLAEDLLEVANRQLVELSKLTDETAGVAELGDDSLVHLGQVAAEHDVSVRDWTGFRVDLHSGCIGFVMLAHLQPARVDAYLDRDLESFSPQSMTDPDLIRARLAEIRRTGWLWTTDEYAQGVTTVAAAIRGRDGSAVGSLYVHGPSYRFPPSRSRRRIGLLVAERAASVGAALGWVGEA